MLRPPVRLQWGLLVFLLLSGVGCEQEGGTSSERNNQRPNVLFLLVDDLRPELGAYGKEDVVTPNVDRLASTSLTFERAYVHQAVCSPSRISLLTGLRPDSTGADWWGAKLREHLPDAVTMPGHFKDHGYTTVGIRGKVFHNAEDGKGAWTRGPIVASGDWHGRGYVTDAAIAQSETHDLGPSIEAAAVPDTAYEDGKIASRAVEQLGRLKNEAPFFLAVGFKKPHLPFVAPQKYWDLYPKPEIELPDNYFPPKKASKWALTNYGELRNYADIPDSGSVSRDKARSLIRGYRAAVSYVDAQVGRVLHALERQGLRENTIVVFWGDHGFKIGEHKSWSKHTNFEVDTRIPLMVRVPGMETAGERTDGFVETVDIYPTLTDLAGLPPPPQHQGTSFGPLLEDPNRPWKDAVFGQFGRQEVLGRYVRTDRYRYVEWIDHESGAIRARELYDHRTDPQENVNVAGRDAYQTTVDSLARVLDDGWTQARP